MSTRDSKTGAPPVIKYTPHKKQLEFHQCNSPFKWFCCGVGAGKSTAAVNEALRLSLANPGKVGIMVAPSFKLLHQTLMEAWKSMLPPVLGLWTYNAHSNYMQLSERLGGGQIFWRSSSKAEELAGINAAWFVFDECGLEPKKDAFDELVRRLRDGEESKRCGVLVGTPNGSAHWTAQVFGAGPGTPGFHGTEERWSDEKGFYTVIRASTADNPRFQKGSSYYNSLLKRPDATPEWVDQYVHAKFTTKQGLIFPLNPAVHVVDKVPTDHGKHVVGVDFGSSAPGCMLVANVAYKTGVVTVIEEHYHRNKVYDWQSLGTGWFNIAQYIKSKHRPEWFVADSASPDTIARLRQFLKNSPVVIESNKDTLGSIRRIQKLMMSGKLRIHVSCRNLIREMQGWSWATHQKFGLPLDEPAPGDDHAIDSLRYLVMQLEDRYFQSPVVKSLNGGGQEQQPANSQTG